MALAAVHSDQLRASPLRRVQDSHGLSIVKDCDHATTLIDVSGTIDGSLVSGLKLSDFCGLKVSTDVQLFAVWYGAQFVTLSQSVHSVTAPPNPNVVVGPSGALSKDEPRKPQSRCLAGHVDRASHLMSVMSRDTDAYSWLLCRKRRLDLSRLVRDFSQPDP